LNVETFVTGPFQENCYIVSDAASRAGAIVDPGDEADVLSDAIRKGDIDLRAIWLTHAHIDHIGAVAGIRRTWSVPIYLHPAELPFYQNGAVQASYYGLSFEPPPPPDVEFVDGMSLTLGTLQFQVMFAPGHAPGHVIIYGHGVAFVGDCLFAGSIGRTDLPLANGKQLARTLARIAALPPETRVLSGHGPPTTVGEELRSNPFLSGIGAAANR
jgi:glyoxylase-like metal-dependent hydrolase (beta-lactamase superfamily II)